MRYTLLFFLTASYLLVASSLRAQQARSASDFVESVGVCTHFDYTNTVYVEQFPRVKELLGELGVRYIRDRAGVNNDRGQARCRELFEEHGIKNVALFNPRSQRFLVPERIDEMVTRAAAYPQMYAALEGPNEYDINHPAADTEWVKTLYSFQQQLYSTIKNHPDALVRQLPILGPSVTFSRQASVGEMGDFSGVCDYYNVHAYPGAIEPGRKIDDYLVRVPLTNGPIPLYATETGYHTAVAQGPKSHYPISEEGEAKYLPRLFMDYFSKGVVKTFTYELLNYLPDPTNTLREENFGLIRNDLTPKPAYYAVKNMLSLLSDESAETGAATGSLKYTLGGQTEGVKQLLFQKADGKFYLALWREVSVWDREAQQDIDNPTAAVTLTFDQPVLQTRVYLPYNTNDYSAPLRAVATRSNPTALTLSLPDHLMLVEIDPSPVETFAGTYQLLAKHSGRALATDLNSVTNGGFTNPTADGTNIFQYGTNTYANRLWNIEAVGQDGYYTLTSTYSNRMLAVDLNPTTNGGKQDPTASGTNVFQYGNNTDDNRLWKIEAVNGGYYKLTNKYSGKVLDVSEESTADGANVRQWSYGGGANQQWKLVAMDAAAAEGLTQNQAQLARPAPDLAGAAVLSPVTAQPADAFVESIGANVHLGYNNSIYDTGFPTIKARLEELGIRHLRDGGDVTTDKTWAAARVNELHNDLGIRFTLINGARTNGFASPLDPLGIEQSLQAIKSNYAPSLIAAIEGPNEYNIANNHQKDTDWVATLRAYQKALYTKVRADGTLKNIPVIGPSLTQEEAYSAVGNLEDYLDFSCIHAYKSWRNPGTKGWGSNGYGSITANLTRSSTQSPNKPVQSTECGYHNLVEDGGVPESVQGKYTPRTFAEYFRRGIARSLAYELVDQGTMAAARDKNSDQLVYGLLRNDLSRKPAFYGVKGLIDVLSDPGHSAFQTQPLDYAVGGATSDVHELLLQKHDGSYFLVIWLEVPSYSSQVDAATGERTNQITDSKPQRVTVSLPSRVNTARLHRQGTSGKMTDVALTLADQTVQFDVYDRIQVLELSVADPATPSLAGTYQLVARHSGKALAVDLNSATNGGFADPTADGTNIFQYGTNTYANRLWNIEAVGQDGYYTLTSTYSNRMLAVDLNPTTNGGKQDPTASGTNVFQYGNNTDDNRLWKIEAVNGGYYKLTNKYSGKVLDVSKASTADGANVQQWSYGGGANQQWKLVAMDAAAATKLPAQVQLATASADALTVAVYPNPVSNRLTVAGERPYQLALYDATGRLLLQQPHPGGTTGLDVSHLPAGLYTLSLAAGGEVLHRYRVVKE